MNATKEMQPTYKIFVVDDDDFDNLHKDLPYMTKEKLKDSMGFANPKTMEAYVRKTGVAEIDDITMEHEFQELLAKTSPDEIDGIRYKKVFKDIIAPYILPVVGALLGGPAGASLGIGSTVGSALGGAAASAAGQYGTTGKVSALPTILGGLGGGTLGAGMSGGIAASKAAGGGFLGQTLSGIQSAVGMTPGAAKGQVYPAGTPVGVTNTGIASQFPGSSVSGLVAAPLSAAPQTLGIGQSVLGSAFGSAIGSSLSKTPQVLNQGSGGAIRTTGTGIGGTQTTSGIMSGIGKLATPQNILGAATLGSSLLPKTPEFKMPSYVSDLQSKLMAGQTLSPLGQQARSELSSILSSTPQELYPTANNAYYDAALRRTRTAYEEAQKNLDAAYNVAGVYGSGEHLAAKAKLQQQLTNAESDLYAQTEQRNFELARTEKYNAIQTALGVDAATMDDIVGLTGLDVQAAAMAYGADAADVQAIRDALGTAGIELLLRGKTGTGTQTGGAGVIS
jgi:hypothetical protein